MKPGVLRLVRVLSLLALVGAALVGVYGLGHQNNPSLTQIDCRALQRVVEFAVAGHNPYDRAAVDVAFATLPYKVHELFYPPSFIALTAPFVFLGDVALRSIVVCAQVLCFLLLISPVRRLPQLLQPLVLLSPVVLLSLYQTARFGQITCIACAAALVLWDRLPRSKSILFDGVLLCIATVKPSSTLAVLVYLLLERRFAILAIAALLHVASTQLAYFLTGIDPLSLMSSWVQTLPRYREFAVNTPEGNVVYGISVLIHRVFGSVVTLELLTLPLTYLVWRMRTMLAPYESIALLLLIAFIVGTPHAYDLFMLVPAMVCILRRPYGVWVYTLVTLMVVVPQRVLEPLVGQALESLPRVLAPVVLFLCVLAPCTQRREDGSRPRAVTVR
jgi:hypothetical protein